MNSRENDPAESETRGWEYPSPGTFRLFWTPNTDLTAPLTKEKCHSVLQTEGFTLQEDNKHINTSKLRKDCDNQRRPWSPGFHGLLETLFLNRAWAMKLGLQLISCSHRFVDENGFLFDARPLHTTDHHVSSVVKRVVSRFRCCDHC